MKTTKGNKSAAFVSRTNLGKTNLLQVVWIGLRSVWRRNGSHTHVPENWSIASMCLSCITLSRARHQSFSISFLFIYMVIFVCMCICIIVLSIIYILMISWSPSLLYVIITIIYSFIYHGSTQSCPKEDSCHLSVVQKVEILKSQSSVILVLSSYLSLPFIPMVSRHEPALL